MQRPRPDAVDLPTLANVTMQPGSAAARGASDIRLAFLDEGKANDAPLAIVRVRVRARQF